MIRLTKQLLTITIILFFIVGCSPKTTEERIAMAEQHLSQGDKDAAVIELKNAVSVNLTDPLPRFMLAKIYIDIGDLPSAVKEFLKARELGFNENEVLPYLALSYYHMEEFEAASEVYFNAMSLDKKSNSTLALYAYISTLRDSVEGNNIKLSDISSLLAEQELLIAKAVKYIEENNTQAAIEELNLYQSEDNLPLVYSLKGHAYFYHEQLQQSIESLKELKVLMPVINSSSYLLANAYLKEEQFEEALNQVNRILKASPENIAANVIKAKAEYGLRNYDSAILSAEKAIQNGSRSTSARAIAGVSNYLVGKTEQAYTHLNAIYVKNALPLELYRLLAELQIELGYSNQAKKLLENIESSTKQDANYFAELGLKFAVEGDINSARNLLRKASAAAPEDMALKLKKAIVDLNTEPQQSIRGFESVIEADPTLDIAWVYLAISKLENEGLEAALKVSEEWKSTNEIDGSVLEGVIFDRSGRAAEAEVAYLSALSKNETHSGANVFLARLYDQSGRREQAYELAAKALILGANQIQLSPLVLRLGVETKQHSRSVEIFKTAYEKDTQSANLLVSYGAALRLAGEIQLAADLLSANTNQLNGFGFLTAGDSYIDLRQYGKALIVFEQWRNNFPQDAGGYLRAIGLLIASGQLNKSIPLTLEGESRFPDLMRFKYLKLQQMIFAKRFSEAKETVNELKSSGEDTLFLLTNEGNLAYASGEIDKSIGLRSEIVERQFSYDNVYNLTKSLGKAGRYPEALRTLDESISKFEMTIPQQFKVAMLYEEIQGFNQSAAEYKKLLANNSTNVIWLNNLASVQIKLKELDAAQANAETAEKLAVGESAIFLPYINATLGKLWHLREDYSKAYEKFELAIIDVPKDTQIKLDFMETLLALKFYEKFDDISSSIKPSNKTDQERLNELLKQRPE